MRCLFVKPPFAGYIVDGVKLIEYRTRETYIRGRVGIIESGTGTIIGTVDIFDCYFNPRFQIYEWYLHNPKRFATPVPFERKRGAMVWIDLDVDLENRQFAPCLTPEERGEAIHAYEKDLEKFFAERRRKVKKGEIRCRKRQTAH